MYQFLHHCLPAGFGPYQPDSCRDSTIPFCFDLTNPLYHTLDQLQPGSANYFVPFRPSRVRSIGRPRVDRSGITRNVSATSSAVWTIPAIWTGMLWLVPRSVVRIAGPVLLGGSPSRSLSTQPAISGETAGHSSQTFCVIV